MRALFNRGGVVRVAAALAVVAAVIVATRFSPGAGAQPNQREIVLVAREMTFYLDGQPAGNPTLRFKAGETVRLVLRNQTPGLSHDFAIPQWLVATRLLAGPGTDVVSFTVPNRPGRYEYICNPHALMMRGAIVVE